MAMDEDKEEMEQLRKAMDSMNDGKIGGVEFPEGLKEAFMGAMERKADREKEALQRAQEKAAKQLELARERSQLEKVMASNDVPERERAMRRAQEMAAQQLAAAQERDPAGAGGGGSQADELLVEQVGGIWDELAGSRASGGAEGSTPLASMEQALADALHTGQMGPNNVQMTPELREAFKDAMNREAVKSGDAYKKAQEKAAAQLAAAEERRRTGAPPPPQGADLLHKQAAAARSAPDARNAPQSRPRGSLELLRQTQEAAMANHKSLLAQHQALTESIRRSEHGLGLLNQAIQQLSSEQQ